MSFDILAPHYRWMEFVLAGEKLQRCRNAFLPEIPVARNILLLGEGHGRCLLECRRRFPGARITCVDSSGAMLDQARRRLIRHELDPSGVEFVHSDVLHWEPAGQPSDLIVTHFFIDCFRPEQLERIIGGLGAATTPDASWLIADFQNASSGLRKIRTRMILWAMYAFFQRATRLPAQNLTKPDPYLERAGFALHRRTETEWGLLHSDWWKR